MLWQSAADEWVVRVDRVVGADWTFCCIQAVIY